MESSYDALAATIGIGIFAVFFIILLAISILLLVSYWKVLKKAGKPGWAVFIPFYFQYCLFDIAFGSGWLFLPLCFIPCVNVVLIVMLCFKLASAFGKQIEFGFGLLFLSFIFIPILAFGDAEYYGPA